jgi:hypothetical protein
MENIKLLEQVLDKYLIIQKVDPETRRKNNISFLKEIFFGTLILFGFCIIMLNFSLWLHE